MARARNSFGVALLRCWAGDTGPPTVAHRRVDDDPPERIFVVATVHWALSRLSGPHRHLAFHHYVEGKRIGEWKHPVLAKYANPVQAKYDFKKRLDSTVERAWENFREMTVSEALAQSIACPPLMARCCMGVKVFQLQDFMRTWNQVRAEEFAAEAMDRMAFPRRKNRQFRSPYKVS